MDEEPSANYEDYQQNGEDCFGEGNDQNYQDNEYNEYQNYDYMDNENFDMIPKNSSDGTNKQYEITELFPRIIKQVQYINDLSMMGFDWSLMLYSCCQWSKSKCEQLIMSGKQEHKKMIGFSKDFENKQGQTLIGLCVVCDNENGELIRNICGHFFCFDCWKGQLSHRSGIDITSAYPPCIQLKCQTRMSHYLCQFISEDDIYLKKSYSKSICRSYALTNNRIIVCKGRKGMECSKCFTVQKYLGLIQCQNCGNLICPICGEFSHGAVECSIVNKWKEVNSSTMGFIELLSLQICPKCEHGVERYGGCNQIKCRCQQVFCYLCGKPWESIHQNQQQYCPNYKEVWEKYKDKRNRKKNRLQFKISFIIEEKRQSLRTLEQIFNEIQQFKNLIGELIKKFLIKFLFHQSQLKCLESMCTFMKKTCLVLWGEVVMSYFEETTSERALFYKVLSQNYQKFHEFLFNFVKKQYNLIINPPPPPPQYLSQNIFDYEPNNGHAKVEEKKGPTFEQTFMKKVKELEAYKTSIQRIVKDSLQSLVYE